MADLKGRPPAVAAAVAQDAKRPAEEPALAALISAWYQAARAEAARRAAAQAARRPGAVAPGVGVLRP